MNSLNSRLLELIPFEKRQKPFEMVCLGRNMHENELFLEKISSVAAHEGAGIISAKNGPKETKQFRRKRLAGSDS